MGKYGILLNFHSASNIKQVFGHSLDWLRSHFALKVTDSVLQVITLSVCLRNGDQDKTLLFLEIM
jgi:hypothetical protein